MTTINVYGGPTNAGKLQVTNGNVYLGVDLSGNFVGDSSSNVASLAAVQVIAQSVHASTIIADNFYYHNIDLSGSLIVDGSANFSGPVNMATTLSVLGQTQTGKLLVDTSANFSGPVNMASTLRVLGPVTTPGGFTIDLSGNVTANNLTSQTLTTTGGGFQVDISGNVILNELVSNGIATFNQSASFGQGVYVGGGEYVNNEYVNILTVGDGSNGNGVTMGTSGQTLAIFGVTQDTSAILFPIEVSIKGSLLLTDSSSVNTSTITTTVDVSNNYVLGLIVPTGPISGTQIPDYNMPIYINGQSYLLNLKRL